LPAAQTQSTSTSGSSNVDELTESLGDVKLGEDTLIKDDDESDGTVLHDIDESDPNLPAWANSDRDYSYTEMLDRIVSLLREKNPALGNRKRIQMHPPQLHRIGTRKTMWANFKEITELYVIHHVTSRLITMTYDFVYTFIFNHVFSKDIPFFSFFFL
jgi:hypothetical protein